jgi:hypothetical protein
MKPIIVTLDQLREWNGCEKGQVEVFEAEWGESVELSRSVLARAAELGLDVEWWLLRAYPSIDGRYWAALKPIDERYRAALKPIEERHWAELKPINERLEAAKANLIADILGLEKEAGG